jgi:hypothetical protein
MDLLLQCYQNIVGEKRQKFCLNTEKAEEKKEKHFWQHWTYFMLDLKK